jgi:hypothetical protein
VRISGGSYIIFNDGQLIRACCCDAVCWDPAAGAAILSRKSEEERTMRFVVAVMLTTFVAASGWGQTCSDQNMRGMYSVVCSGFTSLVPNGPQAPFSALGTANADSNGFWTGTTKASIGGVIVEQSVSGTARTNPDCTGSITYEQKINGQPAGQIHDNYNVLKEGKEIRGMSVDPGSNILCNLRLMSRGNAEHSH